MEKVKKPKESDEEREAKILEAYEKLKVEVEAASRGTPDPVKLFTLITSNPPYRSKKEEIKVRSPLFTEKRMLINLPRKNMSRCSMSIYSRRKSISSTE